MGARVRDARDFERQRRLVEPRRDESLCVCDLLGVGTLPSLTNASAMISPRSLFTVFRFTALSSL